MSHEELIWRFTPSRTSPQLLEDIFVQRHDLLNDLLEKVRESVATGNRHQVLLVGPRGIGKTHLISLLHHRLKQQSEWTDSLRIAWLLEDETVTSFAQLLKRIYELLSADHPDEFPGEWLRNLLGRPAAQIQSELEARLVSAIGSNTLLLFIENLDLIFEGLGSTGQKQWRSFLQEHPLACIVASTQRLFPNVQKRSEPFFGFFAPIHLKPLAVPDATTLLERIAAARQQQDLVAFLNTPEGRSRVRALHHLAGGNHRIYIVLSGFITRESLNQLVQPFEKMADELTPYYQERLRWLSPQQRQIVEFLCGQDTPVTPKEIALNLMATESTISSQLKKLLDCGYLLRSPRGRESLYELAEPLMRLASEVKEKRRQPLRMLVDFLRIWYRPEQLPKMLRRAKSESLKAHISAAIERSESSPDPRLQLLDNEIADARSRRQLVETIALMEERAHVLQTPESISKFNELCERFISDSMCMAGTLNGFGQREAALEIYDEVLAVAPNCALAWMQKGWILRRIARGSDAIKCFDQAIQIDERDSDTWYMKGRTLQDLGEFSDAIDCYDTALELSTENTLARFDKPQVLLALARWDFGFRSLSDAFRDHPNDVKSDDDLIVHYIHTKSDGPEAMRRHVMRVIEIYAEAQQLARLGDGLVRSLAKIDADMLSEKALALWRDLWLELGRTHVELELPLRLFRVGIEYLMRHDERVLFDLVTTERRILQQALGLDSDSPTTPED